MSDVDCGALREALAWEHERVHLVQDADSGLRAAIAIHSTVLGPALGGMRIRAYEHGLPEALDDVLRLSRAMTLKASAAGLDLGGGKCVVLDDGRRDLRRVRLVRLAQEIERLGGAYITAEDVGTTTGDMDLLAGYTSHVVGRSADGGCGGDPSPATARTVLGAIRAALAVLDGDAALPGRTVGVVGLGKVGGRLAAWLVESGARVVACDPAPAARERAAAAGVELADGVEDLLARQLDVLAPCALGGLVDADVAERLRCRVVCGAANNPLDGAATAAALDRRGILSVPDFLANCGGLIHADAERRRDRDGAALDAALAAARERTHAVLAEARASRRLPVAVAEEHAWRRIERAGMVAEAA